MLNSSLNLRFITAWWLLQHLTDSIVLGILQSEFLALQDFYVATQGDHWNVNTNWQFDELNITHNEICNHSNPNHVKLHGITCEHDVVGSGGHVGVIDFVSNNLNGTIPDSIGNLSYLQLIEISAEPNLYGTLPEAIFTNLTLLEGLNLQQVNISGTLSKNIKNLSKLQLLIISSTNINGTLPTAEIYGINTIEQLQIKLNKQLTVKINGDESLSLCNLTHLTQFVIYDNLNIEGTFPFDCFFNNITSLTLFQIGYSVYSSINGIIDGTIDKNSPLLYKLPNLKTVEITNTRIDGNILESTNINMPSIASFSLYNSSFYGTIDASICNSIFKNFWFSYSNFAVEYNFFNGTIPKCLFETIFNNNNNFHRVTNGVTNDGDAAAIDPKIVAFMGYNQLSGTIATISTVCNNSNNTCPKIALNLGNNQLSGNIPSYFTKGPLRLCALNDNQFTGSLPSNWDTTNLNVKNNRLSGTIDENLINPISFDSDINQIADSNNRYAIILSGNLFSGAVPTKLINKKRLKIFMADNNKFETLPIVNHELNPYLETLTLSNNKIVEKNIGKYLKDIFTTNELSNSTLQPIKHLLLHNNRNIKGNLNDWNVNYNANFSILSNFSNLSNYSDGIHSNVNTSDNWNNNTVGMVAISLHNCSIHGMLSPNLQLANTIKYFTVFDNQLSCSFPDKLLSSSSSKNKGTLTPQNNTNGTAVFVIFGNLFSQFSSFKHVDWIRFDGNFENASNLYLTYVDTLYLYADLIAVFVCVILIFVYKMYQCMHPKSKKTMYDSPNDDNYDNSNNNNRHSLFDNQQPSDFIDVLEYFLNLVSKPWILLLMAILTGIYYVYSNYYQCGRVTSHFSLSYFEFNNNDNREETIVSFCIVCIYIAFNVSILRALFRMKKHQFMQARMLEEEKLQEQREFGQLIVQRDEKPQRLLLLSKLEAVNQRGACKCGLICIFWFMVYLFGVILTMVYVVSSYLPNHNKIMIIEAPWQAYLLKYGLILVLFIIGTYVAPVFVDSLLIMIAKLLSMIKGKSNNSSSNDNRGHYLLKYRILSITILRSLMTIFVPFIASLFVLNDCGKYWTKLWDVCENDNKSFNFDMQLSNEIKISNLPTLGLPVNYVYDLSVNILTHSSVCGVNSIYNIYISKCLRQFLDYWIPIISGKLILVSINPFIILTIKKYLVKRNCCKEKYNDAVFLISVDSEYCVVATKFELFILFGLISPYLVVIISFSFLSNWLMLKYLIKYYKRNNFDQEHQRLKTNFQILNWNEEYFPINFLFVTCIIQQVLLSLICFNATVFRNIVNNVVIFGMIGSFVIMDLVYVIALKWIRRKIAN